MGTTADKLNAILNTKEAIKQAIRDKGVYIGDYDAFAEYPDAIRSIETSSGESGEEITGSYIIAKFPDDMEEGNDYIKRATELDVSHLDISRMRTMNDMFNCYENLTALDLSNWDVSNIEEMVGTFDSSGNITTFGDISNWNTSNLRRTRSMFGSCQGLTELNLSNWDVNNLEDMYNMFASCENLEVLDLRNWDVSNLEQMERSFYACNKLHTIRLDNCNHDTINKVVTSSEFPTDAIGATRKIYVNPDNIEGLTAPTNWIFVDLNGNEISGEPEEPTEPEEPEIPLYEVGMFSNAENKAELTEVNVMVNETHRSLGDMFYDCTNLTTINNIDQWDTSNVENMKGMFHNCTNLTTLDLSNFNTSNVFDMGYMFWKCSNLEVLDIRNFDLLKIENISHSNPTARYNAGMLMECANLRELRLDNCSRTTIRDIITSYGFPTNAIEGVTRKIYVNPDNLGDLAAPEGWIFVDSDGNEIVPDEGGEEIPEIPLYVPGEFKNNSDITEVYTLVTKEHTDLNNMFFNCINLTTINGIDQWDTSNVTDMFGMFENCKSLTSLDLSNFDTSNVNDMRRMFGYCSSLIELDLSNFDTSKARDVDCMLERCENLHTLILYNCDYNTINKIITSSEFPTGLIKINGITRKMYVQEANIINPDNKDERLTAPDGWEFVYIG